MKNQTNRLNNLILSILAAFVFTNCGAPPAEEADSKEEFEELVEQYNQEKEIKALSYNWTLNEIDDEIFDCQTKEYSRMDRAKVDDFCTCKTQMLARRWDYIEYKHYSFSYEKVLADSGRLDICSDEKVDLNATDSILAIDEDRKFKASEATEAEARENLVVPEVSDADETPEAPAIELDENGFEVGQIFKIEDDENGVATVISKFSEYQKLPNQDYSLAHSIAQCNDGVNLLSDLCDFLDAEGYL